MEPNVARLQGLIGIARHVGATDMEATGVGMSGSGRPTSLSDVVDAMLVHLSPGYRRGCGDILPEGNKVVIVDGGGCWGKVPLLAYLRGASCAWGPELSDVLGLQFLLDAVMARVAATAALPPPRGKEHSPLQWLAARALTANPCFGVTGPFVQLGTGVQAIAAQGPPLRPLSVQVRCWLTVASCRSVLQVK